MSYIKHLFIALLIVLGTAGITFSNTTVLKLESETRFALDTYGYITIDGILYWATFDNKMNIIRLEHVDE